MPSLARTTTALVALSLMTVSVPGSAAAAAEQPGAHREAAPAADTASTAVNPWLRRRVMNMAHAGGENEAPLNTMYAFKRAAKLGADMIELDVQSTSDDQLVVLHNATVDETTNGKGRVRDMTFNKVRRLDAAYNFVPGRSSVPGLPPDSYPLRGVRTHDKKPPKRYKARDFAIPSLREVLRTFRHVPVNIEIKGTSDTDTESFLRNARLLAKLLNKTRRTDFIVTSFNDRAVETFHRLAPRIPLAPGRDGLTAYFLSGTKPIDGTVALQVPVQFSGIPVATKEFIARAHADGYAVHVWFSGTAPETETTYNSIIDACADGLMPAWPTLLERILDERRIVRPGTPGVDPCR